MRIIVSSPSKMGNKWIKCLLSRIYNLEWIIGDESPNTNIEKFSRFVSEDRFPDNTIFHQHCRYKPYLCDVIDEIPAHSVTIVRDPYDTFVSLYHWIQSRTEHDREKGRVRSQPRPRDGLLGKAIDDPAILDYLAERYGEHLRRADEWLHSGRAIVVRYEALHEDAVSELTRATDAIAPVDRARIDAAIESCSVDNMRKMSTRMSFHVRSAKVGDSRDKLSEPHLKIFRERHGALLTSLGYEVR